MGPLGPAWAKIRGGLGTLGPWGPKSGAMGVNKFENLPEICILAWSKMGQKKLGFRPRDPHGEIRAGILCQIPVLKSQMAVSYTHLTLPTKA